MTAILIGLIIAVLDQFSKYHISQSLYFGESHAVIPSFFHLTYLRNTGAVWGIFQYQNEWLVLLSVVVLALIAAFYRWLVDDRNVHRVAVGLMIGGITGNLIDRIRFGWVTDFLDFHWAAYHWPAFNVADAAICTGVAIYVSYSLWLARPLSCKPSILVTNAKESSSHADAAASEN